jgi:hypothetical protein
MRSAGRPADDRDPCPDGACIGVIGPDGHCIECGRRADAVEPPAAEVEERGGDDSGDLQGPDPEDRVPCPDGACIGIIGPDGRCCVCRRRPG